MSRPLHRAAAVLGLVLLALVVPRVAAEEDDATPPVHEAPIQLHARDAGIGGFLADRSVRVVSEQGTTSQSLHELVGEAPLVLIARSPDCPLCRKYGPSLSRLTRSLTEAGTTVLLVAVTDQDVNAYRADVERHDLHGTLVHDLSWVAELGFETTTEVRLYDSRRTLLYRGAVDDQYGLGYAKAAPTATYLLDALSALDAGELPAIEATTAPGCRLRLPTVERVADQVTPTYHREVARILERNCVACHREGEAAPFPLDAYEPARVNAGMIEYVVERRTMPPWFAAASSHAMSNDARLSDEDRATLLRWIEADCPEGDEADHPVTYAPEGRWRLGEPDQIVSPRQTFEVPAEGVVDYRYAVVPLSHAEDLWVDGFEIRNDHPSVLHHVLVFLRYPRRHPHADEQRDTRGGLEGFFAAMVPGQNSWTWPEGTAKRLPADAALVFQIHYTPDGEAVTDRVQLGLHLSDGPPAQRVISQGVYSTRFKIPPGADHHPVHAKYRFPSAGRVTAFMPHMHLRGSAFRYELELADGERTTLLDVPRYDFNWQLAYRLREPLAVPKGAVLHATGWFDNSEKNPANPDPTAVVRFGEQTFDEMMIGYFDWLPDAE